MKAIIHANIYDFYSYRPDSYLIFDRKITETSPMSQWHKPENCEVIDAKGAFLLPGLLSCHAHLYGAYMRGCPLPPIRSTCFREQLEQLYWTVDGALDVESSYWSAKTLALDHIRCGVTTIFDHHASGTQIEGTLDALKQAWVDESGLRGLFCFETSDRFDVEACIRENLSFAQKGSSEMHGAMFGMHASLSLSERTLDRVAQAIGNIPLHVHVGESLEDEEESVARYGKRIVERFADHGLITPNSIFAHCVNINAREAALMAEYGATAAINVTSNLNTGNGIPDFRLFRRYGVPVMVGNDTLGTNIAADLRNTMFGMHLRTKNPWWFDYSMLLDCIRSGYEFASRLLHIQLGRLEAGCEADFALAPYLPPTPITQENVWAHILDGIFNSYRPSDVWCAGEAKMRNYQVQFDESEICQKSRASAQKVWARISQQK
ncbi:amidohydrolase family protein [Flavonifractor sp. An112]|uniref:amidohydrolase family protein n=1 Tax=Flavonifractor sp. An112 TaxID=1965544 RepID=UPI00174CE252|nr:amidohydrolase family protein [Flavonifractor sp. An112]